MAQGVEQWMETGRVNVELDGVEQRRLRPRQLWKGLAVKYDFGRISRRSSPRCTTT
jgi:hypothetical protein